MKLPKNVNISGNTYNVTKDASRWGGICSTGKQEIVVGTKKDQSARRIFGNYIHEVIESVTMERNLRYTSSDCIRFVMSHKEFDSFVEDVSTALYPMIRK